MNYLNILCSFIFSNNSYHIKGCSLLKIFSIDLYSKFRTLLLQIYRYLITRKLHLKRYPQKIIKIKNLTMLRIFHVHYVKLPILDLQNELAGLFELDPLNCRQSQCCSTIFKESDVLSAVRGTLRRSQKFFHLISLLSFHCPSHRVYKVTKRYSCYLVT